MCVLFHKNAHYLGCAVEGSKVTWYDPDDKAWFPAGGGGFSFLSNPEWLYGALSFLSSGSTEVKQCECETDNLSFIL
jgi:hypothetical protein